MIDSVTVFDGLAAIAGVHAQRGSGAVPRVGPAQPVSPKPPRPEDTGDEDSVEISPEAQRLSDQQYEGRTGDPVATQLTQQEQREVEQLKKTDGEIRAHEQSHKAAAGPHGGSISYDYTTGPDGRQYATGGEVPIDVSPVQGDPQATITKMHQVRRAALAPAEPSAQDRRVAAQAAEREREAQSELQQTESGQAGAYGQSVTPEPRLVDVVG